MKDVKDGRTTETWIVTLAIGSISNQLDMPSFDTLTSVLDRFPPKSDSAEEVQRTVEPAD